VAEETIGGYRLLNLMMTGQSSQVWEVVELSSHRHFAMKLLLPEMARRRSQRGLLYHEAEVGLAMGGHENVIRIVTVNEDNANPFFVMEFFPGGSLKFRLVRKQHDFLREHAQGICKQAATALAFMHAQGWVHRDVKPDNMLVNSAGQLKMIDFALATRIEKPNFFLRLFRPRAKAMGTRSYMSPEQIRNQWVDGRADIYSFGATCFELVAGRPPFRGATSQDLLVKHIVEKPVSPRVYNPDVTDEFANLVLRMLAKKKEDRPQDFHEVLMALRTMRVFKQAEAKPEGPR
jgi:serine/threonine protein kinase